MEELKQACKYSQRFRSNPNDSKEKQKCQNCTVNQRTDRRCPVEGRNCDNCGQEGHFTRSALRKKKIKKTPTGPTTTKKREADRQYRLEEQNTKGSKEEEEPDPFLYRLKVNNVKINWQGL